jgi:hypothetical protein
MINFTRRNFRAIRGLVGTPDCRCRLPADISTEADVCCPWYSTPMVSGLVRASCVPTVHRPSPGALQCRLWTVGSTRWMRPHDAPCAHCRVRVLTRRAAELPTLPGMTTPATPRFKTSRMLGRIGMVIIYQALALTLGATGAAAAMSVVDFKELGALLPVLGFLILVELILIIRVAVVAWRVFRSNQRDVAIGWLIGLLAVAAIPLPPVHGPRPPVLAAMRMSYSGVSGMPDARRPRQRWLMRFPGLRGRRRPGVR